MRLEEHHHIFDLPLLDPCLSDPLAPNGADPLHLDEALGLLVDDLQGLHAEVLHEPLGHDLADPLYEARAEVLLDAHERGGLHGDVGIDAELLAVLLVRHPLSGEAQTLARLNAEQVADGGDEIPGSGDHELHDAPGILFVRERYAFEHALDGHGGGRLGEDCGADHRELLTEPTKPDGGLGVNR